MRKPPRCWETQNPTIPLTKGEERILAEGRLFDTHKMLLNVENGTLDLATQDLREFRREDFLTKRAQVQYDAFALCPRFDAFLDYTFSGNQDTIHFIIKALGYALTGDISEQCFFVCYGLGANGKTTLIDVMMQILGPALATPAKFTTFIQSKNGLDYSKYELAQFKGKTGR